MSKNKYSDEIMAKHGKNIFVQKINIFFQESDSIVRSSRFYRNISTENTIVSLAHGWVTPFFDHSIATLPMNSNIQTIYDDDILYNTLENTKRSVKTEMLHIHHGCFVTHCDTGIMHNEHGPAYVNFGTSKVEYFLNGTKYSKETYLGELHRRFPNKKVFFNFNDYYDINAIKEKITYDIKNK